MSGSFALMLHCHMPYCRMAGVWPAGEEWLLEAMNETYVPLLRMLHQWHLDGLQARLTVGLVPILMEQLADPYMNRRFTEYLDDKIARARRDIARLQADPARQAVARYWADRFVEHRRAFDEDFGGDLLGSFRRMQEVGCCEVITSAATHAFLPLLERDSAVRAQVRIGQSTYLKHFGREAQGFWMPECAYRPAECREGGARRGIDEWLRDVGVRYTIVESVGLTRANLVASRHRENAPTTDRGYALESDVKVFGRNEATGRQVWSSREGYPGDPAYLEFHCRDADSGLQYHAVTGADEKRVYQPDLAQSRVECHAGHFASLVRNEVLRAHRDGVDMPVVVAPYDGELFGHWWHEGVDWIDRVARLLADDHVVRMVRCSDLEREYGEGCSTIEMRASSWGENADFGVWLNEEHGWVWPIINQVTREMEGAVARGVGEGRESERGSRLMRQAARETLLLQASDWPFLLHTRQAKEYANQRFHQHHQRLRKLLWALQDVGDELRLSERELCEMENVDAPWPDLDWQQFGA